MCLKLNSKSSNNNLNSSLYTEYLKMVYIFQREFLPIVIKYGVSMIKL